MGDEGDVSGIAGGRTGLACTSRESAKRNGRCRRRLDQRPSSFEKVRRLKLGLYLETISGIEKQWDK